LNIPPVVAVYWPSLMPLIESLRRTPLVRPCALSSYTATSRTGRGPANLAAIRAAVIAAIKHAGYLHVPEGRRDHTTLAEALHLHGFD
jgi:hypothetical protein